MNLVRFDPFRELEAMSSRLNRLFDPSAVARLGEDTFADFVPPVDLQETDKEYVLKADLPSVKKEDIKVDVDNGILTVQGQREQEKEEKNKKFHRVERSFGTFVRRMTVPADADSTKVAAEFKDGVLTVHIPKSAESKPHSIDIRVA